MGSAGTVGQGPVAACVRMSGRPEAVVIRIDEPYDLTWGGDFQDHCKMAY